MPINDILREQGAVAQPRSGGQTRAQTGANTLGSQPARGAQRATQQPGRQFSVQSFQLDRSDLQVILQAGQLLALLYLIAAV